MGVLAHLATEPLSGGARALQEVFTEGRDALQVALNELRSLGLTSLVTYRQADGSFSRKITVTDTGFQELEKYLTSLISRTSILPSLLNSFLANYPNSLKTNSLIATKSTEQVREDYTIFEIGVKDMSLGGTPMDPDDLEELKAKDKARKQREHNEARQEKANKAFVHRNNKPIAKWTVSDSASYFGTLVSNIWRMKPWSVSNSRFTYALSTFRKNYETDGELEKRLIDLFIDSVAHDTKLDDPEHLWRMFIKRAPGMVEDVRRQLVSPDDKVTATVDYDKTMEKFNV
jgi:hypothetical protein